MKTFSKFFIKYEDFILKCKERLCSAAQLEIMKQTRGQADPTLTAKLLNEDASNLFLIDLM